MFVFFPGKEFNPCHSEHGESRAAAVAAERWLSDT